jgi:hypothetical protein
MTWPKVIPILILWPCLLSATTKSPDASVADATDFDKAVVPVTALSLGIGHLGLQTDGKFGTGFCLDPECRFIGTNYHVAVLARPRKIKGEKIIQRYLDTGPDDDNSTVNEGPMMGSMKFTLNRDLAIFELRHSLPDHHGVTFSLDNLEVGQQVNIYAYPLEGITPMRKLMQFAGAFRGETKDGLLAFDYLLSAGKAIRPGASGGIVVDAKTNQAVGILSGIDKDNGAIVLAVPVQSLVEFVSKVQPFLADAIFPSTGRVSTVSPDLYPKFVPPFSDSHQHRSKESEDVASLRSKAQDLTDGMRNFIAVQSFAWGSEDKRPAAQAAYEVQVIDGNQRFRSYPDGKKELQDVPFPPLNNSVVPGGEWSELPEMVGTKVGLRVRRAGDAVVDNRRIRVFQYYASAEDRLCPWRTDWDFGLFTIHKDKEVACYGEVWTDDKTNIVRMSVHLDELTGKWKNFYSIVTYGWWMRSGEKRLIPMTISTQAEYKKHLYWCRGQFTDYRLFTSEIRMLVN